MKVPRPLLLKLIRESALLWLGLRLLGGLMGASILPIPFGIVFFPALVAAVAWINTRIAGQHVMLGNLGVSPLSLAIISVSTTASIELAAALLIGMRT